MTGYVFTEQERQNSKETSKRSLTIPLIILVVVGWRIWSTGGLEILGIVLLVMAAFFLYNSFAMPGKYSWQYCMDEQGVAYRMSNYKKHHRIAWAEVKEVKVVRLIRTMEPNGKHKMDSYIVLSKVSGFVPHEAIMGNLRKKEAVCIPYSEEAKACLQHYMPNLKTN